jgi:hypothetical protein
VTDAGRQSDRRPIVAEPDDPLLVPISGQDRLDAVRRPGDVDDDPAASSQTGHSSAGPSCGQCRQQLDLAGVALQEHLRDSCRRAEVAVDLERRMRAEQVRVDTGAAADVVRAGVVGRGQERVDQPVCTGRVPQAGTQADLPGQRPSSGVVFTKLFRI